MKKVFISYKFTGEDVNQLMENMGKIIQSFRSKGLDVFCSIEHEEHYQKNKFDVPKMMTHALAELDSSDVVFVYNNSDQRSEGMLIEIGYAVAKGKPVILAAKRGISVNSSKGVASSFIEFETLEDLLPKIAEINI